MKLLSLLLGVALGLIIDAGFSQEWLRVGTGLFILCAGYVIGRYVQAEHRRDLLDGNNIYRNIDSTRIR